MSEETSISSVGIEIFEKEVNIDAANLLTEVSSTDDNLSDLSDDPELVFADYGNGRSRNLTKTRRTTQSEENLNDLNLVSNYLNVEKYKTRNIVQCSDDSLDELKKDSGTDEEDLKSKEKSDVDDSREPEKPLKGKKLLKAQIKNVVKLQHWKHKCFYLFEESIVDVCRMSVTELRFIEGLKPKYIKWERHQLVLDKDEIRGAKATGYMESPIPYSSVEDVHIISRWDAGQKFCIRVTIQDGSLLLQANNSHLRDQWLYSIQWKKHMYKYEKLLKNARRPEVLVKEIKNMIDVSLHTPIQDPSVYQFPLDLVSELLQRNADVITKVAHENIIVALAPLLENNHPTQEICDFFSKHCKNSPRSSIVIELFTPVVQRILKHNMDFGKFPRMRQFVQEYIQALNCQNAGLEVVKEFIKSMHGPASVCPHPRVLPNLVAVCLAAVYSLYEDKKLIYTADTVTEFSSFSLIIVQKVFTVSGQYRFYTGACPSLPEVSGQYQFYTGACQHLPEVSGQYQFYTGACPPLPEVSGQYQFYTGACPPLPEVSGQGRFYTGVCPPLPEVSGQGRFCTGTCPPLPEVSGQARFYTGACPLLPEVSGQGRFYTGACPSLPEVSGQGRFYTGLRYQIKAGFILVLAHRCQRYQVKAGFILVLAHRCLRYQVKAGFILVLAHPCMRYQVKAGFILVLAHRCLRYRCLRYQVKAGFILVLAHRCLSALADDLFTSNRKIVRNIATTKCGSPQTILGNEKGKKAVKGALMFFFAEKGKKLFVGLKKKLGPVMLLSLRENIAAMEVLCAMLECDVVENNDLKMQMVTTLQSTMSGKRMYADLCERQIALRELIYLDLDLEIFYLIFQFGDVGLQKISEHLHKLQVLNLCETPVSDKGLSSLAALKHLRKLNLNSTNLSALVFEGLKEKLPALQECDVRYTDAW
ncbi:C-Maf-inducing protein-like [Mercenaria mercenaria]|uniref:C-Maf-inducing protein-like n=1 Tax=Mercenaria mercenaria TaxID=6596 RepID=UPI00234EA67C|nr:C-Maf-inducing protein-like [Mercenaria mercenaria]